MDSSNPTQLSREAIIPVPASRRLTFVLAASVLLVSFTAFMDAMLWTMLSQPMRDRREAVQRYQLRTLRVEYAQAAAEARQQRERADTLSAALLSCTAPEPAIEFERPPRFATPCTETEIEVRFAADGPSLCVPALAGGTVIELAGAP